MDDEMEIDEGGMDHAGGSPGSSSSQGDSPESQKEASAAKERLPLLNACEDHWSWNPKERSHEIRLNGPKHRIAHFHPNWSNGTAGIRGTRVLNNGRFYWEVNVSQRIFGTR